MLPFICWWTLGNQSAAFRLGIREAVRIIIPKFIQPCLWQNRVSKSKFLPSDTLRPGCASFNALNHQVKAVPNSRGHSQRRMGEPFPGEISTEMRWSLYWELLRSNYCYPELNPALLILPWSLIHLSFNCLIPNKVLTC